MSTLQITLLIGLIGSLLMYVGDMTLYFDKNDYDSKDKWNSMFEIMGRVDKRRFYIGGLLGPLTAFLYALSFYHIILMTTNQNVLPLSWISFLISVCGIFFGGAYHLEYALLGLLVKDGHLEAAKKILKFVNVQGIIVTVTAGAGTIIMFILIVAGWTVFPQWMGAINPLVLFMLLPLWKRLPRGLFHMLVCGGWSNLPFVIYYLVALIISFTL
ncbi:MAG: hypothetical protein K5694_01465 [Bacilli bacterium]|nr:hypothetical protein [Bacilli bacterium]